MTFPGGDQRLGVRVEVTGTGEALGNLNRTQSAVNKTAAAITQAAADTRRATGSIDLGFQQSTVAALRFGAAASGLKFGAAFLGIQSAAALIGDLFGDTVKAFSSFEDSFADIRKTADLTEQEFKQLEKANRELAKSIPVTVNELNKFGAIAGQIGTKNAADIRKFEETIARLKVSVDGININEAALLLAQFAASTQTPIGQIDKLASVVVRLGNELEANEGPIIEFAQRVGGVGQAVGISAEKVIAIGAAFASVGVEAEAGATAIQKTLLTMSSSVAGTTKEAQENLRVFAAVANVSAQEFKAVWEKDPAQAFRLFVEGIATVAKEDLQPVFDALGLQDTRLVGAFTRMAGAGDKLKVSLANASDELANTNALTEESNKKFDTFASRMQVAKNKINDNAIEIGRSLSPALLTMNEALADSSGLIVTMIDAMEDANRSMGELGLAFQIFAIGATASLSPVVAALLFLSQAASIGRQLGDLLGTRPNTGAGVSTQIIPKAQRLEVLPDGTVLIHGYRGPGSEIAEPEVVPLPSGETVTVRKFQDPMSFAPGALPGRIRTFEQFVDYINSPAVAAPEADRRIPGLGGDKDKAKEAAKTALEGFLEALNELNIKRTLEEKFGELGAAAIARLATAIVEGASSSDGAQVVGAITDLIEDAKEAGIPNAQALGDDLIAAISSAMAQKTPEAFSAATAAVQRFTDTLAASRKTTEDALNAIADVASATALVTGDAGDAIGAALVNAITDGSKEAVRSFNDEMDRFVQEANRAGITVGEDLTSALATAIRDGTPQAVTAALEMIAKIDAAMQASAKAVEQVNFLGGALMESLREQAQEEADLARSALEDQAKAARDFADTRVDSLRAQEQAAAESFQNQAESARDGFDAQADAAREFGETATEASRDRHKELIRLIDDQTFFALKALDDEKEAIKRQQKEIKDARTDTYDLQIQQIESALDARLAAIDAELRALEDLDDEDERIRLDRDLALAYDNDKRFDAEQALRRFDRNERRQALQREASDLRGAAGNAIDALKNQLDEIEELQDEALQIRLDQIENEKDALSRAKTEEKRILDDWLDAAIETIDAEEERRLKSIETQEKAQLASLEARAKASANSFQQQIQAAEAARDRELVIIEGQQEAVEEAYRQRTSAFAIEGEARKLIEDKNQAAIIALIGKYFPQWETAGFSLGDQLVAGMERAGIQTYLDGLLSQINATKVAATTVPNPFLTGWGPTPTQPGLPPGSLPNRIVIPGLDAGGIVTGPTMAMLSMNSVPEIVMPLPQYLSQMSNGVSLSLDLRGSSFMGSPQQNGSEIASQVESMMVSILTRGAQLDGVSR